VNEAPRATDVKTLRKERHARDRRFARQREESDMDARERVLRGELSLEDYLRAYRGYSADMLAKTLRPH
jgi:hypothetical protein